MPAPYIEHVNLSVSDPARTAQLMVDLFDWHIRWEGAAQDGGHTIHVGDDRCYFALYTPATDRPGPHRKGEPLNHVGVLVDDLDLVEARVVAAGLRPFSHMDYEPGRRFYFFDSDRIEYEIVSYG